MESKYIFEIRGNNLYNVNLSHNNVRAVDGLTRGFLLRDSTSYEKVMITNNMIRGIEANRNKYFLPDLVEDVSTENIVAMYNI